MADGEIFTVFVDSRPDLSLPMQPTDEIAIVRNGVTFKVAPTDFSGVGTVTSVSFAGDGTVFSNVPGAPVTTTGTLFPVLNTQLANTVLAGPVSGGAAFPTFRLLTPVDVSGFTTYVTPTTGATITAASGQGAFGINPAGTIAVLHMILPPGVSEGQVFDAATTQEITAFDAAGAGSDSVVGTSGGPFRLPANDGARWRFRLSNTTWYPAPGFALPADIAYLDVAQSFTKAQRGQQITVTPSGSTFTPDMATGQHFNINLVSGANMLANPTNVVAGQVGMLRVTQSSGGGDTLSFDTDFKFASGSAPALSSGASAVDYFGYYVDDATHIVISAGILNVS